MKSVDDGFIPMEIDDLEVFKYQREKRNKYWASLKNAREHYNSLDHGDKFPNTEGFYYWLQKMYGLKLKLVNGNIEETYEIIDSKKFLLYRLKYGI